MCLLSMHALAFCVINLWMKRGKKIRTPNFFLGVLRRATRTSMEKKDAEINSRQNDEHSSGRGWIDRL